ncbi:Sua5 YciO YrdC YwlC family protein [Mariniradius saccharolyticus AK6]|uniref:Threonylcarbamoyl-AMP synthase n=1 Tax=Mariniradius saccharolyticus AK6 TaxID=1239962 RepID=M7XB47_9BACT|nr:L-threonylcarbamoyladenylate synthase [Mariniradius saccharolyticus]EMS34655.1 Sua5 YciO YrdC YwlC family protein [Mariniradius saccharolyticus AK6]
MAQIGTDIEKAKALLESGELVAIPTETVYGLAGNALNPDAVAKIFSVKNRPSFDPLIIHTDSLEKVRKFTLDIPAPLDRLAAHFWPGPLTLLLPKKTIVPDLVTSGLDTVAVRIPQHTLTLRLLEALDFPLAAPSANPFGYISPTTAAHVQDQLGDKIPYILDGGPSQVGLESTIVGLENGEVTVYRLGGLEVAAIETIVGPVKIMAHSSSNPKSPGMLKSHYAPKASFVLGDLKTLVPMYQKSEMPFGILSFSRKFKDMPEQFQKQLSKKGDLAEAAKNLFAHMRALDSVDVSVILAELLPDDGLGKAINDRLKRAAAGED